MKVQSPHLAMRAALAAILDHNDAGSGRIRSVAVPGLGTGVGGMSAEEAAPQMRVAYEMIALGGWKRIVHPIQAPLILGMEYLPSRGGLLGNP